MMRGQCIAKSILICFILLFFVSSVNATDYTTIVKNNYVVSPQSELTVRQLVTIENNTDTKYPTSIEFTERTFDIKNLKILGPNGQSIFPSTKTTSSGTQITIPFPEPIVGRLKSQTYDVSFQNNDMRIGSGNTIELHLPPTDFNDPQASISGIISIPTTLCSNPYVVPTPTLVDTNLDTTTVHLDSLKSTDGIFVRCVAKRSITAVMEYALENNNMTPIETQITLPPDTNFQYFEFTRIDPLPLLLSTDNDGNRIATYKLEPKQNSHITVEAQAVLSSTPNQVSWSSANNRQYLNAQPHWAVGDSGMKKIISSSNVASIESYLLQKTTLVPINSGEDNRHGSKQIVAHANELTAQDLVDATITLKRTAGIMARRMVGVVTNSNSEIRPNEILNHTLHAWLDYYDNQREAWLPEDITWAKTTTNLSYLPIQDLNHIVLAINGLSDTTPYPVGFYSSTTLPAPQVSIIDIPDVAFSAPNITATVESSWFSKPKLILTNNGHRALYKLSGTLNTDQTSVPFTIDRLPIGGQGIIPITLPKAYNQLTVIIGDQHVPVTQHIMGFSRQFAITCAVVATAGFFAVLSGRLLVSRRKR